MKPQEAKGALPTWLSPVQVKVLPITDKQLDYAISVKNKIKDAGIRVKLDDRQEKLGYKIREAQVEKVPYIIKEGTPLITMCPRYFCFQAILTAMH